MLNSHWPNYRGDVLETVARCVRVLAGGDGELLAVLEMEPGKHMVVVYRELVNDGFVITAFVIRRVKTLAKRKQLWP